MYFENDEGIDSNSSHRDYPTFMPDETSMIFPQKLDLSTLNTRKTPKKKKISPIKANPAQKSFNLSENSNFSQFSHKKYNETVDLQEMRNSFNEMMAINQRKLSDSSVTSDRASSVCSTSSGQSQKSLFVQVTRAKKLVDQREETQRKQRKSSREAWEDSDWCIGTTDTDNDDTRPPSSQPSLAFESGAIEQHRLANRTSELMDSIQKTSKKKTSGSSRSQKVNTATNTTRVHLSDTQLYDLYDQRRQKSQKSRNLNSEDVNDDDNDVTLTDNGPDIVESAFQGYYAEQSLSKKKTPILSGFDSAHFAPIEKARNANRSASLNNIMTSSSTTVPRNTVFDGFAPGALRHSISTIQVSPQKLRELEQQNKTHPIPSLAQFRIPKSTRTIFPLPLMDIDEISGRGVRKDKKSTQRHFSGQAISTQIHGPPQKSTPRGYSNPTVPQEGRAARPTTASQAKKVDFQLENLNLAAKNSNLRNSNSRPPVPYCSATSADGTAYSIHTVTQQLLGTVKSLHPDWLQMTRRLLENSDDVASEFRRLLILEKESLETKWRQNRNDHPFEEDPHARITVIRRVLEKLEDSGSSGHLSKIQQLKVIHSALLST
ncbi:hypothetical protein B9Z55_003498 [Caenorhabditis nigoni]|uniref:Uncharacterized protein n=1 Tax=Caenorhabditis nigoni TaxID=1611254 RepID=A0A2G5VQY8_9PELO|nr:hypothetical protein B9Z55_003498 [Caenorhabditis nigoni]